MRILTQQIEVGDELYTDPSTQAVVAGKRANPVTEIETVSNVVEHGSSWHIYTNEGNHFVYPVDYHVSVVS